MLNEAEKDRIAGEIGKLFDGLEIQDVAGVLTVQLAMLAAQGGDTLDEAVEFLDEIHADAKDVLETIDFEDLADEKDEDTDRPN